MSHDPHPTLPSVIDAAEVLHDPRPLGRRRLFGVVGATVGAVVVAACSDGSSSDVARATIASSPDTSAAPGSTTAATAGGVDAPAAPSTAGTVVDVEPMPAETGGPFAADGTNDNGAGEVANVLAIAGVIRSDIRSDIGGGNEQPGAPMTLTVTVVDATTGAPRPGAAVYVWHCNQAGGYSFYNSSLLGGDFSDVSWLRGVQIADANGTLSFRTILPGRYPGRAAHIHFDVFADETFTSKLLTSQMAFDDTAVDALYAAAGYADALEADTDNDDDGVFRDGWAVQALTLGGDVTTGITASIVVGV